MSFSIIAAIGKNHELGKKGNLVFQIPNDLKFFKQITSNSPVVMGRTTFLSLPKLLKNRTHYVLSPDEEPTFPKEVIVVHDLSDFIKKHKDDSQEFFVIGGGSIYQQFLPFSDKLFLTEVDGEDPDADVFFPSFNRKEYIVTSLGENSDVIKTTSGKDYILRYRYKLYQRKNNLTQILSQDNQNIDILEEKTDQPSKKSHSASNAVKNPKENREDPVFNLIKQEEIRQTEGLELIPSENYVSQNVLKAMGSILTNKYSEGYPSFEGLNWQESKVPNRDPFINFNWQDEEIHNQILPNYRYYGGQTNIDRIERIAIARAMKLFHADHANVQPHSGANANEAVYFAWCKPGDKILAMDLGHGGHLTHGSPVTRSAKIYNFLAYKTTESGDLDYDMIEKLANTEKPKVILIGYSAFMKIPDFTRLAKIGKKIGALLMADMAHVAGLIAGGVHPNPLDFGFHVMTTTTHKTLRGPRGGLILSNGNVASPLKKPEHSLDNIPILIDRAVFPGTQGGPLEHVIAAKAVAFKEALSPQFREYAMQITKNAKVLASSLKDLGFTLQGGGTENHLILIDIKQSFGIDGKFFERALDLVGLTLNANSIPNDKGGAFRPSGVRLGTPAITTRGMKEPEMKLLAFWIEQVAKICVEAQTEENLNTPKISHKLAKIHESVIKLSKTFPIPKEVI